MNTLREGRIPMNEAEHEAVDHLVANSGAYSITRRDPGETGPLVVHADRFHYLVDEDGKVTPNG